MNKVKVVVDSTIDLTPELYKENELAIVPLNVNFGEENFKDGVTITNRELFKKVEECGELPSTAAPSPADFEQEFKKWIDQGYDIIYMGISSTFSTALQNANIAAQEFEADRIYLIDSQNLSSGTALMVLKAVNMAKEGKTASEIKAKIEEYIPNVRCQFALDTLDYLHKGGRCSGVSKIFGQLFHIHPIVKVEDGKMVVASKPRGPQKIALNEMAKMLESDLPNVDMDTIFITHSLVSDETLDYFKKIITEKVGEKPIKITEAGCVISTHCGPKCIGVLYIKK